MPQCAGLTVGRFGFEACYSCVLVGVLLIVRCWLNASYMRVRRSSLHTEELFVRSCVGTGYPGIVSLWI